MLADLQEDAWLRKNKHLDTSNFRNVGEIPQWNRKYGSLSMMKLNNKELVEQIE
jgi:hypothetical protein